MVSLCLVSDTHEQHSTMQGMQRADILLHAGDFTYHGKYEKIKDFSDWLELLPKRFPCSFGERIVIPGNHDLTFESNWREAELHLEGATAVLNQEVIEVKGLRIYGEPRQPWFFNWAFNVRRELMSQVWDQVPTDIDVLLTHGPPWGVGDRTKTGDQVGCKYQRDWILNHQPKLVVCGHIHEGYGIYMLGRTMVVNASICDLRYNPINRPIVVNL